VHSTACGDVDLIANYASVLLTCGRRPVMLLVMDGDGDADGAQQSVVVVTCIVALILCRFVGSNWSSEGKRRKKKKKLAT